MLTSLGRIRARLPLPLRAGVTVLSLTAILLQWSPLWAEISYVGCGGEAVGVQNMTFESEVIALVNQERAHNGLPPMKSVPELTAAARYHAADMAQDDYFSHNSQDRVNGELTAVCAWSERIKGYYSDYRSMGENIAWGYGSPESVMQGWMNSDGHRANILGAYTEIGVGYIDNRWVQDFGERRSTVPLIINSEAVQTLSSQVTLYIHGSGDEMRLRNDDLPWGDWQAFQTEISWQLQNLSGERRVDIEVRKGSTILRSSDTIVLAGATAVTPTPPQPSPTATPVVLPPDMNETVFLPMVTR
ncbi:MAG: CAP domain-containing protein [Caldilineaceae bacterium]